MIKKLLMFCAVFLAGTAMMNAQFDNIGILGGSTSVGWDSDLNMSTTDGITYTYSGLVVIVPSGNDPTPGVKFRKDDLWTVNWGGSGFPNGTAFQDGPNIPATNGTWDVTFNKNSGAYSFVPAGVVYDAVTLTGGGVVINLSTGDGMGYEAEGITLAGGTYYFSVNGVGQLGGENFPEGNASEGMSITVPAGLYNISYYAPDMYYEFDYVNISLLGSAIDPDWLIDVDLYSDDGIYYFGDEITLADGVVKFRQNYNWDVNWGSTDFPIGTGVQEGADIPVVAGTYNVLFNRVTGQYSFVESDSMTISLVGEGFNMAFSTTDMENFTMTNVTLAAGQYYLTIFGIDQWGGSFPAGTVTQDAFIDVPAGTYDIWVSGDSGDYTFNSINGLETVVNNIVKVYPNPSSTSWNILATDAIDYIEVADITGKVVASQVVNAQQAVVDASGLTAGVYFAKVSSGQATQTVKVVKN